MKKWEEAKIEELDINETAWNIWKPGPPDGRPGNGNGHSGNGNGHDHHGNGNGWGHGPECGGNGDSDSLS